MRPLPEGRVIPSGSASSHALITAAAVAILVFGVYPTPLMRLARQASATLPMISSTSPAGAAQSALRPTASQP
jgi:hypothetical protein